MNTAELGLRRAIEQLQRDVANIKGRLGDLEADIYEEETDDQPQVPNTDARGLR